MHTKFWSEDLKRRCQFEDALLAEGIMTKWILRKYGGGCGLDSCGLG
jgi:hypothetical protein